jgi:hypothetical protein
VGKAMSDRVPKANAAPVDRKPLLEFDIVFVVGLYVCSLDKGCNDSDVSSSNMNERKKNVCFIVADYRWSNKDAMMVVSLLIENAFIQLVSSKRGRLSPNGLQFRTDF